MTSLSSQAKKDRLLRVFERTGGSGSSALPFESLPPSLQEQLRGEASLTAEEEPILVSYRAPDQWLLLTSEYLIAKAPTSTVRLHWSEISDATIDPSELQGTLGSPRGKLHLRRLRVTRTDGGHHDFEVEPGPSYIALWNVLKTVANLGSR